MNKSRRNATSTPVVVGVGWYAEPEWAKVKTAAADPELFEATFSEWADMAEEALVGIRRSGVDPVKVQVTADELLAWCLLHKKVNDASGRSEFVCERVRDESIGARYGKFMEPGSWLIKDVFSDEGPALIGALAEGMFGREGAVTMYGALLLW